MRRCLTPEAQAREVQIGQRAQIEMASGRIHGVVSWIDPSVRTGTVQVDVELAGPLPNGARPDLSVEGRIVIEKIEDAIFVGRPAYGQENTAIDLFKIEQGGLQARRVPVRLGRMSANSVEILDGLEPGDQVILSELAGIDEYEVIRLQ